MEDKSNSIPESKIELRIEGKKIPLKPFVADFIQKTIIGMISSLRGTKKGMIEIKLRWE
ncbi:MAG: hypothetical protein ABIF11_03600 [Nitrospirota bacterium]